MQIQEKQDNINKLENIERELTELSELMTTFRELVAEQKPIIDTIEKHIEASAIYTVEGVEELETAELCQRKTRIRRIKVISGAVFGGLLFGGVGAMTFGASQALVASGIGSGAGAFTGFLA